MELIELLKLIHDMNNQLTAEQNAEALKTLVEQVQRNNLVDEKILNLIAIHWFCLLAMITSIFLVVILMAYELWKFKKRFKRLEKLIEQQQI